MYWVSIGADQASGFGGDEAADLRYTRALRIGGETGLGWAPTDWRSVCT